MEGMSCVRILVAFLLLLPGLAVAAGASPVARVLPDGTLVTGDGTAMRLAHLRLPQALGPAAAPLQERAVAVLREICVGRPVAMERLGLDRWQRVLVTARLDGGDLEAVLLGRGLAVVDPRDGIGGDISPLLAAEDVARQQKRGLWADALRVYQAGAPMPATGFAVVEGRVAEVARVKGRIYVNFGADYKTDFTVLLEGDVSRAFEKERPELTGLAGHRIRVRGMLEDWNGPLIRLVSAQDMEFLSAQGD